MQVVPPLPLNVVKALQISLKFRLTTFPFLSLLHETILYFFIFLFANSYYNGSTSATTDLDASTYASHLSVEKFLGCTKINPPLPDVVSCPCKLCILLHYHHTYKPCVIWFDSCCFAPQKVCGRCPCVASGKCVCQSVFGVKHYSFITHIKLSFANVVIVLLYSLRTSTKSAISHILALVWCASYCFLICLP